MDKVSLSSVSHGGIFCLIGRKSRQMGDVDSYCELQKEEEKEKIESKMEVSQRSPEEGVMDCFVIQYVCPGEIELFFFFPLISLHSPTPLTQPNFIILSYI